MEKCLKKFILCCLGTRYKEQSWYALIQPREYRCQWFKQF